MFCFCGSTQVNDFRSRGKSLSATEAIFVTATMQFRETIKAMYSLSVCVCRHIAHTDWGLLITFIPFWFCSFSLNFSRNPPLATKAWWRATKTKWSIWPPTSRKERCNWWSTSSSQCWTASSEEKWRRRRLSLQRWNVVIRLYITSSVYTTISECLRDVCFSAC